MFFNFKSWLRGIRTRLFRTGPRRRGPHGNRTALTRHGRVQPRLESLEDRTTPAAVPLVTLVVPPQPLLGEQMTFTLRFDNVSAVATDVGYGPYIDLTLPATGADGAGAAGDDGITFNGATFLGQPVTATTLTFDPAGQAVHPFARDSLGNAVLVTGTPGDQLVVLTLPFGSFTPDQPAADITVTASVSNLADVGTPLTIRALGGFRFGQDALDNPLSDPPLRGATSAATATPTLLNLTKTYVGPEDETATGPNFPRQYVITVDIAAGQTITNLDLSDVLPSNVQFVSVAGTAIRGTATATAAVSTPSTTVPGGTLTRRFASVTGTTAADDATLSFTFYVPLNDSSGNPVLNPVTGDDAVSADDALARGDWAPVDPRDSATLVISNATPQDHLLTDKAIATQKSVRVVTDTGSPGATPGDTLEYTVEVQVSDYFAFRNVTLADVISDGQRFDSTFTPTMQVNGNPYVLPALALSAANFSVTPHFSALPGDGKPGDETDGTTAIEFNLSNELITRGQDGRLLGGLVSPAGGLVAAPGDGPTTVTLVFRTVIQQTFTDTFPLPNNVVNQGDTVTNTVTVSGDLLSVSTLAPTGASEADNSSAGVSIGRSTLQKSIYAINGSTTLPGTIQVAPGDTVTYRLTYQLNTSDVESLSLTDFLPLPVFNATTITTFDNTQHTGAPPVGTAWLLTSDTFNDFFPGITPTLVTNAANNSVQFVYGTVSDPQDRSSTIDIVFTVSASADPFADGLFLTNQVRSSEQSSTQVPSNDAFTQDAIVQVELTEPVIASIRKGVVATSNPAGVFSSPVAPAGITFSAPGSAGTRFSGGTIHSGNIGATLNSDLSNIDAGDLVTFVLVVENTGSSRNGAFDVTIQDTLPAGFAVPAGGLNLRATDGTGAAFTFTDLGGGLFGSGIQLNDPGPTDPAAGALDPGKDSLGNLITTGRNVAILTFDLQADGAVAPRQILSNTATLSNFAGVEGGPDHTGGGTDRTDTATVRVAPPATGKSLEGTEIVNASNSNTQAVIGELVTYRVTVTVPEGTTPNAVVVDTLDSGLAFVSLVGATLSSGLSLTGGTAPVVTNDGQTLTFNLGTVTNSNTDNAVPETITLTYQAVVLNVSGNQGGTLLNNSAVLSWAGNSLAAVSAPNVTVIEPTLTVTKGVVVNGAGTTGDAGDPLVYTITIANPGSGSTTAFDMTLSDPIPAQIVSPTITGVTGAATMSDFTIVGNLLQSTGTLDLAPGATIVLTVSGTLGTQVSSGQSIANTARVEFTSLDGNVTDRSVYNTDSDERTGTNVPTVNDYFRSSTATLTVSSPTPVKSIVGTSEPHTTGSNVTVGEIVRYRLVTRIAEGTNLNFQLRDNLPAGLTFLDDGTATIAYTANVGFTSTNPAGATLSLPLGSGLNSGTPVPLPDANIGMSNSLTADPDSYITVTGTDIFFKLGDLVNNDSDSNDEFITIEFNAIVDNMAGATSNDAGDVDTNNYTVLIGGAAISTSGNVSVTVVEPQINVFTKAITTPPTDAGNVIVYTLTIGNQSGATRGTAYDVVVTDVLDNDLTFVSFTSAFTAQTVGTDPTPQTVSRTGDTYTVTRLDPGQTLTLTITASVDPTASAGETIPNVASLTYTSLPGSGTAGGGNTTGSSAGTPGGPLGERTGGGIAPNDYSVGGNSVNYVMPDPVLDKLDLTQATYTIGEVVTFYINVTLPEGVSQNLTLTDSLPAGLTPTSYEIITSGATSGTTTPVTVTYNGTGVTPGVTPIVGALDGQDVTINFGNVTTTADNLTTNNNFLVKVVTFVSNTVTATAGNVLPNQATLSFLRPDLSTTTDPAAGTTVVLTDATNVSVVEPVLEIAKAFMAGPVTGLQAGDTVTYTLSVTNADTTTGATAFDAVVADTVPAGLLVTSISGTGLNGGATQKSPVTITGSGSGLAGTFDIPEGGSVVITYTATLQTSVTPGQDLTNTAAVQWTSLDGANPNERSGDGTPAFNDYSASDALTVSTATMLSLAKSASPAITAVGQEVIYTLTVGVMEGTTPNLQIRDTLSPLVAGDLLYVPGSLSVSYGAGGMSGTINPLGSVTFADPNLDLGFGDLSNPADGNRANDFITVTYRVLVTNVPSNLRETVVPNSATASATNVPPATANASVQILYLPAIQVVKEAVPASILETGGPVAYTYLVTNTSPAAVDDPLSGVTLSDTDGTPVYAGGDDGDGLLEMGETWTYTLTVVLPPAAPGTSHTNTVTAVGTDDEGNTATATDAVSVPYLPVNDPPSIIAPPNLVLYEDSPQLFCYSTPTQIVISDPDAGTLPVQVTLVVEHGTMTLNGAFGLTFLAGDGDRDSLMTFQGKIQAINTALAGSVFRPDPDYNGTEGRVTITVNDLGNTGADGPKETTSVIRFTITPVNDGPVNSLPVLPQTTTEDTSLVFSTATGNAITVNDVDAADRPVQVELKVANGTLTLATPAGLSFLSGGNGTSAMMLLGTVADINAALDGLRYNPAANFTGTANLFVTTNDLKNTGEGVARSASGYIPIAVTAVNDAPVITVPAVTPVVNEDSYFLFTSSYPIRVSDDSGTSPIELSLSAANGALTLGTTSGLTSVSGNGTSALVVRGTVAALNTALTNMRFTPTPNYAGPTSVTVGVNDLVTPGAGGPRTATATVPITVNAVNDAPVNVVPTAQTIDEDTSLVFSTLAVTDVDAGTAPVKVTLTGLNGKLTLTSVLDLIFSTGDGIADSTMTFTGTMTSINNALNGMRFDPTPNFSGTARVTLTTNDLGYTGSGGAKSDTDNVTVTVRAVNDAPVLSAPSTTQTTAAGKDLIFSSTYGNRISVADVDAGTSPLRMTLSVNVGTLSLASTAGLTVSGNGTSTVILQGSLTYLNAALNGLRFRPPAGFTGTVDLSILVDDLGNSGLLGALTDSKQVSISVG